MTLHVARYWRSYSKKAVGWRWSCRCGHKGTETYADDGRGVGLDHARKAFYLHAEYAMRKEDRDAAERPR